MSNATTNCGFFTRLWQKLNVKKTPTIHRDIVDNDEVFPKLMVESDLQDDRALMQTDNTELIKREDSKLFQRDEDAIQVNPGELQTVDNVTNEKQLGKFEKHSKSRPHILYRPTPAFHLQNYHYYEKNGPIDEITPIFEQQHEGANYREIMSLSAQMQIVNKYQVSSMSLTIEKIILPKLKAKEVYTVSKQKWNRLKTSQLPNKTYAHVQESQKPQRDNQYGRMQNRFPYYMPEHVYTELKREERLRELRRELRLDLETQLDCDWHKRYHRVYQLPATSVYGPDSGIHGDRQLLARPLSKSTLLKLGVIKTRPRLGRLFQTWPGSRLAMDQILRQTLPHKRLAAKDTHQVARERRDIAKRVIKEYQKAAQMGCDFIPEIGVKVEDTIWTWKGDSPNEEAKEKKRATEEWPDVMCYLIARIPRDEENTINNIQRRRKLTKHNFSLNQVVRRGDNLRDGMLLQGVHATQKFGPNEERFVNQLMNLERIQLLSKLKEKESTMKSDYEMCFITRGTSCDLPEDKNNHPSKGFKLKDNRGDGGERSYAILPTPSLSPMESDGRTRVRKSNTGQRKVTSQIEKTLPPLKRYIPNLLNYCNNHRVHSYLKSFPSLWDTILTTNSNNRVKPVSVLRNQTSPARTPWIHSIPTQLQFTLPNVKPPNTNRHLPTIYRQGIQKPTLDCHKKFKSTTRTVNQMVKTGGNKSVKRKAKRDFECTTLSKTHSTSI